ncbi:phosphonate ABC transporter substrate-binding protein, partial [Pseudomonas syringae]
MFKRIGRLRASAALLTACALGTAQAADGNAIALGSLSTSPSQNLPSIWQPYLHDMSRKTGLQVNVTSACVYAGRSPAMRIHQGDVAWLGHTARV